MTSTAWCLVGTRDGFDVQEIGVDSLDAGDILAIYATEPEAELALNRVILLREKMAEVHGSIIERERTHRAMLTGGESAWLASLQHEITVRNRMLLAIHEIAKPRETAK